MYDILTICPTDKMYQQFCDYILNNYISEDSRFPPQIWTEYSILVFGEPLTHMNHSLEI